VLFVLITALLTLVSTYTGVRLLPAMMLSPSALIVAVLVLLAPPLLAGAGVAARMWGRPTWGRRLTWAGSLTLGWVSWLFVLTLLREPVLAIAHGLLSRPDAALIWRASAQAVPLLTLLITLIGLFGALGSPRVKRVAIPLMNLPAALQGFRIVQLTDVHVGSTIRRSFVQHVVDRVNALHPDVIVITGDLVDGTVAQLIDQVAPLAALRSRHGTFFVTGNHEYYSGVHEWIAHLRSMGMRVLMNEHAIIAHGDSVLLIAGVPDPTAEALDKNLRPDPELALKNAPAQVYPRILLSHRPQSAPAAARAGFDLQLSGHTHGGQFWPWTLVVRWREPLSIGLDRLEDLQVYTSRGTGFWGPPLRLGAPSEITSLQLVRANAGVRGGAESSQ
jgi:predicted MPP superfamily phosphohydrolase